MVARLLIIGESFAPALVCVALFFLRDRFSPAKSRLHVQKWSLLPCVAVLAAVPTGFLSIWLVCYRLAMLGGRHDNTAFAAICFLFEYGFLVIAYLAAARLCKVDMRRAFGLSADSFRLPVPAGAVLFLANFCAVRYLHLSLLSLGPDPLGLPKGQVGGTALAGSNFVIMFVGPVIEEVGYRGWLYTPLLRKVGRRGAICLSAAFFAHAHFQPLPGNVWLFVIGVILAWLYDRTGSLAAPIVAHVLMNSSVIYPYLP